MPTISCRIIPIGDAALGAVWQLREDVLRKPLGLTLRNEDLSAEVQETTIAAFDEQQHVIGCVMLRRLSADELKLRQMGVATDWQGKGVGRALLIAAEAFASEAGYRMITLHARQYAVPFYERNGYRSAGEVFMEVGIPHEFMSKEIHAALP